MLTDLTIQDVVIIDRLSVSLGAGFVSLTGETGAGKSIILDSLGLALGARSEARLVRQGCEQASVTAAFDIADKKTEKRIKSLFTENELPFEQPLILRRTLTNDGRSKAFVNDQPVSIGFLKLLGDLLVEIHGQFETQKLLDPKTHRAVLDDFADSDTVAVKSAWNAYRAAVKMRDELAETLKNAARDREYWEYMVAELRKLSPGEGEEEKLAEQRSLMMHAEKLLAAMSEAEQLLTHNSGIRAKLHSALHTLERVQDKMPEGFAPLLETLNNALIQSDEAVDQLETLADSMQFDHNAQSDTDERLFALRGAARKYDCTVADLPNVLAETEAKLNLVQDQSKASAKADKAVAETRTAYIAAAEKLSAVRQAAAGKLSKAVMAELSPLKLDKAQFAVSVAAKAEENWGADGMDDTNFQISTNPGTPMGPLNKIASGGEMARFMLALKLVTAETGGVPVMIFDEVDTGVGGAVADAIGMRLRSLGASAQVLAVTHSPQVAAKGHHHLKIAKETDKKSTRTNVAALGQIERIEEIARMLSGEKITAEARAAAAHLMDAPAKSKRTKAA
jgi:DNA repair protein RecN (Recombination protein N)